MAMNHHLFQSEAQCTLEVDSAKSLNVPAGKVLQSPRETLLSKVSLGADTLEDIGIPRGARRDDFERGSLESRIDQWCRAVAEYFPPSSKSMCHVSFSQLHVRVLTTP